MGFLAIFRINTKNPGLEKTWTFSTIFLDFLLRKTSYFRNAHTKSVKGILKVQDYWTWKPPQNWDFFGKLEFFFENFQDLLLSGDSQKFSKPKFPIPKNPIPGHFENTEFPKTFHSWTSGFPKQRNSGMAPELSFFNLDTMWKWTKKSAKINR